MALVPGVSVRAFPGDAGTWTAVGGPLIAEHPQLTEGPCGTNTEAGGIFFLFDPPAWLTWDVYLLGPRTPVFPTFSLSDYTPAFSGIQLRDKLGIPSLPDHTSQSLALAGSLSPT